MPVQSGHQIILSNHPQSETPSLPPVSNHAEVLMRLLFALFLVMPCWANFLLEYYDPSGATDFSTLVSITDPNSETTQYLLTGEGVNQWPGWVSDAQEPDWAKISYGAPQDMTYQQGECAEGG